MKPVSLSLRAFGSYAGDLCIDFARLGRHGIFAITGPTGAGKSTIFDALVYALYDDLPGFRVNGNVRSQFADPATETSVSLDFFMHGQRWRIERRPTQLVARQRGSGAPVEKKASVVLGRVGADGTVVAGSALARARDVAHRVEELVGLTKEQFEQVVLIPQGRFEEVLKAETSKRAPLLRRLFPVEMFTRVTDSLRQIAAARQAAFEDATRQLGALAERLREAYAAAVEQVPDELRGEHADEADGFAVDELAWRLEELRHAAGALDALVDAASTAWSAATGARDAGRLATERWREWRDHVAQAASFADEEAADVHERAVLERARRLLDLRAALAEWSDSISRLAGLEPERARLLARLEGTGLEGTGLDAADRSALRGAATASQLAGRLHADAEHHRREAERFDALAQRARVLDERRAGTSARGVALAGRRETLAAEDVALGLVAEEADRLAPVAAGLGALELACDALDAELATARRRVEATADVASLSEQLRRADAAVDEARDAAMRMRVAWRDGLAGRLARLLVDGEPCPTCGALEHPAPAVAREEPGAEEADDDALAAAERKCDDAVASRSAVEQALAAAQGVLRGLPPARALDVVAAELHARRAELESARAAAERLDAVATEVERRRGDLARDRRELDEAERALEIDVAALGTELAGLEREQAAFADAHGGLVSPAPRAEAYFGLARDVERLAEVLGEREAAEASKRGCEAVLGPIAAELGASDTSELGDWVLDPAEVEARERALAARHERREEVRRKIAAYLAEVDGEPVLPDLDALEAAAQEADRAYTALVERRGVLAEKLAVLVAGPEMLAVAGTTLDAARRALEQAKTIADQCAGLGGGAGLRLSLENWVLADYLRQVLVQANHRLDAMTEGRFALQLSDGVTDGRKPWGLDLSVFDVHTGQVRPATTLSGGETFMAALSLALGLADVVSGGMGRQIGALFVDEGFGALDPQSLEGVVDVLRSLEDGGRIVGVISHVDEVKHALPTGITVASSPSGSVATLHYPPE